MARHSCRIAIAIAVVAAFGLVSVGSARGATSQASTANSWASIASMAQGRAFHTATRLANGDVLVVGGRDAQGSTVVGLSTAEIYHPATGSWSQTGSLHTARELATATLLPDGRVLIAGGGSPQDGVLSTAEIYDPATGQFSLTGSMHQARGFAGAALLKNGLVLVVGGWPDGATSFGLRSAELYDPNTGVWASTGSLAVGRAFQQNLVVLSNGDVLAAGGITCCGYQSLASSEIYHPGTGTWTTVGSMTVPRQYSGVALLPNGKVLVAGGNQNGITNAVATAEIFDPQTGTWTRTGTMNVARVGTQMVALPDGDVLMLGGSDGGQMLNSSEVFDPTTGRWTLTAPMPSTYLYATATALQDGTVLAVGGQTSDTVDSPSTAQAALFTPAPPPPPTGLMWFNPASGQVASWLFNRFGTIIGSQTLSGRCGASNGCSAQWTPIGLGDVNGDGHTDLMWGNPASGQVASWLLNGAGTVLGSQTLSGRCGASNGCSAQWTPIGLGDVNGDGHTDLMWGNPASGQVAAWLLNGAGTVLGSQTLSGRCGASNGCSAQWTPIGLGDVNGDGHTDLMWGNPASGQVASWLLNGGGTVIGSQSLSGRCGASNGCSAQWTPIGLGDVNGDGHTDLMWGNPASGQVASWLLNGAGTVLGSQSLNHGCGIANGCSTRWEPIGLSPL